MDLGCLRVDERSVLARVDRNHPSHQPLAIDLAPPAPSPDFAQWRVVGSDGYITSWNVSRAPPNQPFIIILGSGPKRDGDGESWTSELSRGGVVAVCIDHERGGYEQDWRVDQVNAGLVALTASPLVLTVVFAFGCESWSPLRCLQPGPPVLFNTDHPWGCVDAAGEVLPGAVEARRSVDAGLQVLRAAAARGVDLIGEAPPSRGKGSLFAFKEPIYDKCMSPWEYPPMADFCQQSELVAVYGEQGGAGAATQKLTEWRLSKPLEASARELLGTLKDPRAQQPPENSLPGGDSGDYSKSKASAAYTKELWRRIITVALSNKARLAQLKGGTTREQRADKATWRST